MLSSYSELDYYHFPSLILGSVVSLQLYLYSCHQEEHRKQHIGTGYTCPVRQCFCYFL